MDRFHSNNMQWKMRLQWRIQRVEKGGFLRIVGGGGGGLLYCTPNFLYVHLHAGVISRNAEDYTLTNDIRLLKALSQTSAASRKCARIIRPLQVPNDGRSAHSHAWPMGRRLFAKRTGSYLRHSLVSTHVLGQK